MADDVAHITDYDRPRLPLPLRAANTLLAPFAHRLLRFEEDGLYEAASKSVGGLDDFGPDDFKQGLRVLLRSLDREAKLSPVGRFANRSLVLQLLCNRLLIFDQLKQHPEVHDEAIERPIIIAGLPRTGTTHLHNLISADPRLRSLPYWESLEPVAKPGEPATADENDARWKRCEQAVKFTHYVMPLFPRMHEMEPAAVHEEIQILAIDFSTMLFESSCQVPSYVEWYRSTDQTRAYRFLHTVLKLLQWQRGPKRWVLKSPQHLEQLRPIANVFPDATVVQTHRDPVRILTSLCTMLVYGHRVGSVSVSAREVAAYWVRRGADLLRASVEGRALLPEGQSFDVQFKEFMADDVGTVRRVCRFAGNALDAAAEQAIQHYMDTHPRGRYGRVHYDLADFGLDAEQLRKDLDFYSERFGVEDA